MILTASQKKYAIVKCPKCSRLQLVNSAAKSHRCPYCDRIIKLKGPGIWTIWFASTPREASRIVMKLKRRGIP